MRFASLGADKSEKLNVPDLTLIRLRLIAADLPIDLDCFSCTSRYAPEY